MHVCDILHMAVCWYVHVHIYKRQDKCMHIAFMQYIAYGSV